MNNKKNMEIADLADKIAFLDKKIVRDGHYVVNEKVKVILQK